MQDLPCDPVTPNTTQWTQSFEWSYDTKHHRMDMTWLTTIHLHTPEAEAFMIQSQQQKTPHNGYNPTHNYASPQSRCKDLLHDPMTLIETTQSDLQNLKSPNSQASDTKQWIQHNLTGNSFTVLMCISFWSCGIAPHTLDTTHFHISWHGILQNLRHGNSFTVLMCISFWSCGIAPHTLDTTHFWSCGIAPHTLDTTHFHTSWRGILQNLRHGNSILFATRFTDLVSNSLWPLGVMRH